MTPSPTPGPQDEIVERACEAFIAEYTQVPDGWARRSEHDRDMWRRCMRSALSVPTFTHGHKRRALALMRPDTARHLPTPPGRWVPLEPTEAMMAMIEAAVNTYMYADTPEELASEIYRAMLEAAPAGGGER